MSVIPAHYCAMPEIGQKRKKECWLQRKVRACRFLAGFVRYWGPLAFREVIEDWQSAWAADGKGGGGDGEAERQRLLNGDTTARRPPTERS
jgi:hypothetical protein